MFIYYLYLFMFFNEVSPQSSIWCWTFNYWNIKDVFFLKQDTNFCTFTVHLGQLDPAEKAPFLPPPNPTSQRNLQFVEDLSLPCDYSLLYSSPSKLHPLRETAQEFTIAGTALRHVTTLHIYRVFKLPPLDLPRDFSPTLFSESHLGVLCAE